MTISYVGGASAEANSLSLPTHQAGDLFLMLAVNPGSTTVPTIPSGWYSLRTTSRGTAGTSRGAALAWKLAASSGETSGTWTNASLLGCVAYRDSSEYLIPGGYNTNQDILTTAFTYNSVSALSALNNTVKFIGPDSWVVLAGFLNSNSLSVETAPVGTINRISRAGISAGELAFHDTNGDVSSWATTSITLASADAGASYSIELLKTGISKISASKPSNPFTQGVIG